MKNIILLILFVFMLLSLSGMAQERGNATYYSNKLKGHHTTDGSRYHPDSLTCAHRTYPFGTLLRVRNPKNDKVVIVRVTDRGPFQRRLSIDLSYIAAKELDIIRAGIAEVEILKIDPVQAFIPLLIPIPNATLEVIRKNDPVLIPFRLI